MKKSFLFLFLLMSVLLTSCAGFGTAGNDNVGGTDNVENNGDTNNNGEDVTDNPDSTEQEEVITVIKDYESVTMEIDFVQEFSLKDYFSYTGTDYKFFYTTEDKGVVNAYIKGGKLVILAEAIGNENVVVTLKGKSVTFAVEVTAGLPKPVFEEANISFSIDETSVYELELNPVDKGGYENFVYSLAQDYDFVVIDGNKLIVTTNQIIKETILVSVVCDEKYELQFKVNIKTTTQDDYLVINGSFDDGLDGWTLEGEFGVITDKSTWWSEGMPMHNDGYYFSGYDAEGNSFESQTGTLTSSVFTLGGNGYITFMLGGSGNKNCYISVEDNEGNVIAIYRNSKFNDFPEGFVLGEHIEEGKEMVGDTVFLANFVKYKADLSEHIGKQLKVVVHDDATSGWGLVFFDELITYHISEIEGYTLAINEMADFTELKALLDEEILSLGDYTTLSFETYKNKISLGKEILSNALVEQSAIDNVCIEILAALNALETREILLKEVDLDKTIIIGDELTLNFADYFDTNNLSNVTFSATSEKAIQVSGNSVSLSTNGMQPETFTITLNALYNNEIQKTVVVNVEVTNDPTPTVKELIVTENVDLYEMDSESYIFDLSSNIENIANVQLSYSINNTEWVELSNTLLEITKVGDYEIPVKVYYELNEEELFIEYTLKVSLKDTTKYRLYNGDFEQGNLDGWTVVGPMGNVTSQTNYWLNDPESVEGYEFGLDGEYMFSAYVDNQEHAYGYLKSSTFEVGGNGWITFKLGAARNVELVNIQIVDAANGDILKTFGNVNWADRTNDMKSGCTLNAYKANISDLIGKNVYIKVVDNAENDYGLFFLDSFNTYYTVEPNEEFALAEDLGFGGNAHQVFNGDFESGNLNGWKHYGNIGDVTTNNEYWGGSHNKEGEWFYSAYAHNDLENNRGYLQSAPFEVGGNGWITFKYGGALNSDLVNIQIVDAYTNEVITVLWKDKWDDSQTCGMFNYKADLSDLVGRVVYFKFVDYAWDSYGLFYVDSIYTNYTYVPGDEFAMATRKSLTNYVVNGDFEYGNLAGWMVVSGEVPGEVLNGSTYWNEAHSLNKDGEWSFQAIEITGSGYYTEERVGVIRSNSFILDANSLFSFKLSGGNHPYDEGIRVVNAATGEVLAQFTNTETSEGKLIQYHYQFSNNEAIECYIEIFDYLTSGWGVVGVDSLVVNAAGTVVDSIEAINQIQ